MRDWTDPTAEQLRAEADAEADMMADRRVLQAALKHVTAAYGSILNLDLRCGTTINLENVQDTLEALMIDLDAEIVQLDAEPVSAMQT
jgi:hypothetical protein